MAKDILKSAILILIRLIETIQYRGRDFDEEDSEKKIIDSVDLDNINVESRFGFVKATQVHKTQPYTLYRMTLEDGSKLECADRHVVFCYEPVLGLPSMSFVKDLRPGISVVTRDGSSRIKSIEKTKYKVSMYDLTVDSEEHSYFTNNILSHNTVTAAVFLLWYCLFHVDKTVGVLANKFDTAVEIADKIKEIYTRLPFFLKAGIIVYNQTDLKFDNGSRIILQATTPRSFIGFTLHVLYCDEFAHVDDNILSEFYENAMPTISSMDDSRIIITSTPNGFNKFYELYTAAVNGENSYNPIRVDWWEHPDRDEKWKEKTIADCGGMDSFMRQYGNSFLASGSILLSADAMEKLQQNKQTFAEKDIIQLEGYYDPTHYSDNAILWKKDFDTEELSDPSRMFLVSIDLAEGGGDSNSDYSAVHIFRVSLRGMNDAPHLKDSLLLTDFINIEQVGVIHTNKTPLKELASLVYALLFKAMKGADNTRVVVELNTYGELFMNYLAQVDGDYNDFEDGILLRYPHSGNNPDQRTQYRYGLKLTSDNKNVYCLDAKKYIAAGNITINESQTVKEFETFGKAKNGTYKASQGHDDLAMSVVDASSCFTNIYWIETIKDWIGESDEGDKLLDELERRTEARFESNYFG